MTIYENCSSKIKSVFHSRFIFFENVRRSFAEYRYNNNIVFLKLEKIYPARIFLRELSFVINIPSFFKFVNYIYLLLTECKSLRSFFFPELLRIHSTFLAAVYICFRAKRRLRLLLTYVYTIILKTCRSE